MTGTRAETKGGLGEFIVAPFENRDALGRGRLDNAKPDRSRRGRLERNVTYCGQPCRLGARSRRTRGILPESDENW